MTKDQVLRQLRNARHQLSKPELEDVHAAGAIVADEQEYQEFVSEFQKMTNAIAIAIEIVQNTRSDNLVFKD